MSIVFCHSFLATYAAAVLFRMSDEKGGEYTKRLSQELRSTLYQRDLHNQMWNGDVPPPDLQVFLGGFVTCESENFSCRMALFGSFQGYSGALRGF